MDKGIRINANHKFMEMLPQRAELGNTPFRKAVIGYVMQEFGATLASASTAYNKAFIEARKAAETNVEVAALLVGLGRAEDKKGGRKAKVKVEATAVATETVVEVPEQTEFTVKLKLDGSVVASGLTYEQAVAMVKKAKAAKKAGVYCV